MGEFEDEQILFPAINARVAQQIVDNVAHMVRVVDGAVALRIGDIRRAVALVVGAVPGLVASATKCVEPPRRAILDREFAQFLELCTPAAAFLTSLAIHALV
jgi:hypothetical protein